jgi:hypothetical protein
MSLSVSFQLEPTHEEVRCVCYLGYCVPLLTLSVCT